MIVESSNHRAKIQPSPTPAYRVSGGALTSVDRGEPRTTALPISKRLDPGVRRSEPLRHAAGYMLVSLVLPDQVYFYTERREEFTIMEYAYN